MGEKGYNGWTNYETWCVALWLDNDEETYEQMREFTKEAYENPVNNSFIDSVDDRRRIALQDMIKEFVEEQNPLPDAGMFTDLLNAAISEVDWRDIAKHYLDEYEPEEEDVESV